MRPERRTSLRRDLGVAGLVRISPAAAHIRVIHKHVDLGCPTDRVSWKMQGAEFVRDVFVDSLTATL